MSRTLQSKELVHTRLANTIISDVHQPTKHTGKFTAQRDDNRHQVFRVQGIGRDAANPKLKTLDIKV